MKRKSPYKILTKSKFSLNEKFLKFEKILFTYQLSRWRFSTFHMSANTKFAISNVAIASTLVTNSPRIQIWKSLIQYLTTVFYQVAMEKRRKNSNLARLSFFLLGALLASKRFSS